MRQPIRILMTVDAVGGIWQYASDLTAALLPLGIQPVLALLGPAPSVGQRADLAEELTLIETGLDLDWLASDAVAVEDAGAAIAALADGQQVDLVHLNQPALAAAAPFKAPVVSMIHSCFATWWDAVYGGREPAAFAWQTDLVSRGLRRSAAIAAPSRAFAEAVQRRYELPAAPHVVPNGRKALTLVQDRVDESVFTAGRLWDHGKNVGTLDRVAARLRHPFTAAGSVEGPNGEHVRLRHLELLGALDEAGMARCLAARPIFVSAARYEPFGLAVLEAASAGCALVLADIPTFRENWDGVATFVGPSDEDGFVAAIEALLQDPDLREGRGLAAKGRAAAYTPARMAAGMGAIYAQALAGHGGLPGKAAA